MPTVPADPPERLTPGSWQLSWVHTAAPLVAIRHTDGYWNWADAVHEAAAFDPARHARAMAPVDPAIPHAYSLDIPVNACDRLAVSVLVLDPGTRAALGSVDAGQHGVSWLPGARTASLLTMGF